MDIDLSQFRDSFLAECTDHIAQIEEGLLELEAGRAAKDRLDAIFRAAHSVKGAAGTFGWTAIVRLTHAMEDLLDRMRSSRLDVSPRLVRVLLSGVDEIKLIMANRDASEGFAETMTASSTAILKEMRLLLEGGSPDSAKPATAGEPEHEYHISFIPSPRCFEKGINPLSALRELADFGMVNSCDLDVDHLPALDELDPMVCHLGWNLKLRTSLDEAEVRTAFSLIDGDAEVTRTNNDAEVPPEAAESKDVEALPKPAPRKAQDAQSIRVPAAKVDQLIDLAGELVIAFSMANDVLTNFAVDSLPRLREVMATMERGTRELQERVMSVRMMPASSVFQRFPRLVYDTAAKTGKQIAIQISGEQTQLDKMVAEQLLDPLTHLIRNSVDHGIETPARRREQGKPEQGTISLRAFHQSGQIVIEVSDDGQGLNATRIRSKAISRGLIAADAQLTEAELQQLIFAPGFSTKDQVSDLSGRGVGMDVVKRNIEALSGTIRLESVPGKGTTVRLYLPLTLAIVDGLLIRVGAQSFALPLNAIVESVRPAPSQILRVSTGPQGGANTVLVLRSETMPLISLGRLFNIPDAVTDPVAGLLVIVESRSRKMALLADDIVRHQQFVIKSVEKNFRRVEGALGATILGDGTVALIIDVSALGNMSEGRLLAA